MCLILDQANTLMNAGPKLDNPITNADVIEAILGDISKVLNGQCPSDLGKYVEQDKECNV